MESRKNRRRSRQHSKARRDATNRWSKVERAANLLAKVAVIVGSVYNVVRDSGLV
ncbi:hypothetical protein [Micromonospora haikouensis]|uniref:hypothetical protein n=1 Tax=Micromonospora haikouensis TaxID=686309 RepID=UPI003D73DAC4